MHKFSEAIKKEALFDIGKRISTKPTHLITTQYIQKNGDPAAPVAEASSKATRMICNIRFNITYKK